MEEMGLGKPRKRRAIGYLAQRILERLPDDPKDDERWEMTIDQISKAMQTRAGQVYEVFHVFEALLLITKVGKNSFVWNGFKHMTQILAFLRCIALCQNLDKAILETRGKEAAKLGKKNFYGTKKPVQKGHTLMIESEPTHAITGASLMDQEMPAVETVVAQEVTVVEERRIPHILTVCQNFLMLFLVADEPKTMSLEFASKVIHGTDLKETYQKARTRRLYDVSNVLLAISERYPLIAKVNATRVGSLRRTAFQYCGPELETVSIDLDIIFNLPDYRRKHLWFDHGKLLLGIPIRPESIPGLKTVRRNQVDQTQPWPIDTKHGLDLTKVTVADLNRPMTAENVIFMECQKMNYDAKQFSSELVKSLKSRKIKKENPTPLEEQETRIESEWQIGPNEEILAELIVPVHVCPVVNIHASMMDPNESQNPQLDELPALIFQDDIEFTETFEADDTNEQNMIVLENNAIECEWQIVENENVVVNNLEGIEIVVDLQPRENKSNTDEWSILPNQVDGLQSSPWNLRGCLHDRYEE